MVAATQYNKQNYFVCSSFDNLLAVVHLLLYVFVCMYFFILSLYYTCGEIHCREPLPEALTDSCK